MLIKSRQERVANDFSSNQGAFIAGILCVFADGQSKILQRRVGGKAPSAAADGFNQGFLKEKTVRTLALAVLTALLLVSGACAEENRHMIQGVLPSENQLQVFLSGLESGIPVPEQFTAALGGAAVTPTRAASAAAQPVTWYCLADVSGSLTEEQLRQEQEVLRAVCSRLSTGDRMVIGRLGNAVTPTAYLWDRTAIQAEIDALEIQKEDTNLYGGIVSAIQELTTSNNAAVRRCLILLSDGDDDQVGSLTREEADRAVREARIPVYSVAVMRAAQKNDAESIENAKVLGSFARESAGGAYYNPILDGTDAASAGRAVVEGVQKDVLLTLDLTGLDPALLKQQSLLLRVRYAAEGATYEDTMELDPARLTVTAAAEEATGEGSLFWLRMAVAGALLLAAVIIFLTGRKKRSGTAPPPDVRNSGGMPSGAAAVREPAVPPVEPYPAAPVRESAGRAVSFTAIGYENLRFELRLPEDRPVTIGRDSRADRVLNPEDRRLSGVHFRAALTGRALRVWDAGSTNGTAVNGVPVSAGASALAEDGQTIRAGSYEYRIHIGEPA